VKDYCQPYVQSEAEAQPSQWQRPDIDLPADPRGGFGHSPEFEIAGSIDNGNIWSSTNGNVRNRFT
jgi:hypothetical protein